jgi:hypothetical protein
MPAEREEEAVDAEWADPAETGAPGRYLPKVFEMRMGVSYFTREKLLDALVVIFSK